jgi:general secretion pathway protein A
MYANFFNFGQMPFAALPEGESIYMAATHREALATLVYGVLAGKPVILLTGDIGLGKSTVLAAAIQQVKAERVLRVVKLPHPMLGPEEILRLLGQALDIQYWENMQLIHVALLRRVLTDSSARGEATVLVIDEAQGLSPQALEFVRLLSNLADASCNFQIVLAGQPELWQTLQQQEFRHLRQRIAIRAELEPLSRKDARDYLQYRLQRAGSTVQSVFTRGALKALLRHGRGVPRRINIIADNALIYAFGEGARKVAARNVNAASATLSVPKRPLFQRTFRRLSWILPVILLAIAVPAGMNGMNTYRGVPRQSPDVPTHHEAVHEAVHDESAKPPEASAVAVDSSQDSASVAPPTAAISEPVNENASANASTSAAANAAEHMDAAPVTPLSHGPRRDSL